MHGFKEMGKCVNSILIVEDDNDIRAALREIVEQEGFPAFEAENGKVALDLLQKRSIPEPCLILLDLMMPEMNGWEFLEIRRQADVIASIPTIVISAVPAGRMPRGATKILRKPVNLIELINVIESYCGARAEERGEAAQQFNALNGGAPSSLPHPGSDKQ